MLVVKFGKKISLSVVTSRKDFRNYSLHQIERLLIMDVRESIRRERAGRRARKLNESIDQATVCAKDATLS